MPLDIEGIRPALIDMPMSLRIEELLKFRHVFRNIYKSPLLPAKVDFVCPSLSGQTRTAKARFVLPNPDLPGSLRGLGTRYLTLHRDRF